MTWLLQIHTVWKKIPSKLRIDSINILYFSVKTNVLLGKQLRTNISNGPQNSYGITVLKPIKDSNNKQHKRLWLRISVVRAFGTRLAEVFFQPHSNILIPSQRSIFNNTYIKYVYKRINSFYYHTSFTLQIILPCPPLEKTLIHNSGPFI